MSIHLGGVLLERPCADLLAVGGYAAVKAANLPDYGGRRWDDAPRIAVKHDESRSRKMPRHVGLEAKIGRRFQYPRLLRAALELPLQIAQQVGEITVSGIAALRLQPCQKARYFEVADRPIGMERVFQQVGILFRVLRGHVMRRVGSRIEARAPFQKLRCRLDARIHGSIRRVGEWRGVEALPEQQPLKVARVRQQLMQLRGPHSRQSTDYDRLRERLVEDFGVSGAVVLEAQTIDDDSVETLL